MTKKQGQAQGDKFQIIGEQHRNALVNDLLIHNFKSEAEIHNRAAAYGWNFKNGAVVVAVDINNIKRCFYNTEDTDYASRLDKATENIFQCAIEEMSNCYAQVCYTKLSDIIVFVLSVEPDERAMLKKTIKEFFEKLRKKIFSEFFTVTVALGCYFENIAMAYQSYEQARAAINLCYEQNRYDCVVFYDEIELYSVLAPLLKAKGSIEYCRKLLAPLLTQEAEEKNYLGTLRQIVACKWNVREAAENLYMHPNSLKYRYNKIGNLLNMNLEQQDSRLLVEIALILDLMQKQRIFQN